MRKLLFVLFLALPIMTIAQIPHKSETVNINGKKLYYEVYGEGEPLFLFHGAWISSRAWMPYVDEYDDDFQVYLVDLPGHGRSYAFNNPPFLVEIAKDVHGLLQYLEVDSINGIGYSYGGDLLFQLALLDPSLIKAFIPIGSCGARDKAKEWSLTTFNTFLKYAKEISKAYQFTEQHIEGIERRVRSANSRAIVSNEAFQKIQSRVLMVIGDDDLTVDWQELFRARKHLPNSDLWIVPNTGHGAHEYANKEEFIKKSKAFFGQ